jgi:hypothetical protein
MSDVARQSNGHCHGMTDATEISSQARQKSHLLEGFFAVLLVLLRINVEFRANQKRDGRLVEQTRLPIPLLDRTKRRFSRQIKHKEQRNRVIAHLGAQTANHPHGVVGACKLAADIMRNLGIRANEPVAACAGILVDRRDPK